MTNTTHFLDPKAAEISRRVSNIFPDRKGTETLVFLWGKPSVANPAICIARVTRESDEDRITYIVLEGKLFKSEIIPPEQPEPKKAHFIKRFLKKLWSFLPNG